MNDDHILMNDDQKTSVVHVQMLIIERWILNVYRLHISVGHLIAEFRSISATLDKKGSTFAVGSSTSAIATSTLMILVSWSVKKESELIFVA